MSRNTRRFAIAGFVLAVLGTLVVWQQQRQGAMRGCIESGGDWNGARATCSYPPGRILIRPDSKRV